jgi:23S rRNA pseudouridine2605 synthase
MGERIHKALARAGYGSRRAVEEWIREGRVKVNGQPAVLGQQVTDADTVEVNGARANLVSEALQRRVIAYHKPEGEICSTKDPGGRPTILQNLPRLTGERWVTIGRLDLNTSGLLLVTNDGSLAHRLMHPSGEIEREYAVRVLGRVTPAGMRKLTTGVQLDDGKAWFEAIHDVGGRGANHWFHVVVKEGRNRIVRRLWESQGFRVSRLIRVRYGPITLPGSLKAGHWKEVTGQDLHALVKAAGLPELVDG